MYASFLCQSVTVEELNLIVPASRLHYRPGPPTTRSLCADECAAKLGVGILVAALSREGIGKEKLVSLGLKGNLFCFRISLKKSSAILNSCQ